MNHGMIAPQFGLAAKRSAEDLQESPPGPPTATTAVAYAGSSAFRPTTEPTVVIKTTKRRRLEVVEATNGGAASLDGSIDSSSEESGGNGLKSPKVFRLSPARPAVPEGHRQPELTTEVKLGADSLDGTSTLAPSSSTPRRRRRRDPVTAPILVRHVVFNRAQAEESQRPDLLIQTPSEHQASYDSVMRALRGLRDEVAALIKARALIAELGVTR